MSGEIVNERLKELYRQAHGTRHYDGDPALDGNPPTVYWQGEASAQRFANLIVRECVEVCASIAAVRAGYNDADGRDTAYSCGDTIKEHFEVEDFASKLLGSNDKADIVKNWRNNT